MNGYATWTLRFHHTAVQLAPFSGNHGPHSESTGASARVADAILYNWIQ